MKTLYLLKRLGIVLFATQITVFLLVGCASDRAVTLSEITGEADAGNTLRSGEGADTSDGGATVANSQASSEQGQAASPSEKDSLLSDAMPVGDVAENSKVFVYVCGKVVNPGVYELEKGSRVCDALDAAGGFLEGADEGRINLAEVLFDGEMIYFPEPDEEIPAQSLQGQGAYPNGAVSGQGTTQSSSVGNYDSSASAQPGIININTASVSELTSLPGIGEAKAKAIIKYREDNGAFKDISDVKKVPGIGDAIFSGIQDLICVQ